MRRLFLFACAVFAALGFVSAVALAMFWRFVHVTAHAG